MMPRFAPFLVLLALPAGLPSLHAESPPAPAAARAAVSDMTGAAKDLLATLDAEQKAKAVFPLDDAERKNWHFIPRERRGVSLADLRPEQDALAFRLLESALSHDGFRKATSIMSLERILWQQENQAAHRDSEKYFISFFGEPGGGAPWAWRFEGHHLAFNFTVGADGSAALTPHFLGSNPGEVREGPRAGLRVLRAEESKGRELAASLTGEQNSVARLSAEAPADIITGAKQRVDPLKPEGIAASALNDGQRALLWAAASEYVNRFRPDLAASAEASLKEGGDTALHFAWAGGAAEGQGFYYRIQSPKFLFEFDNTQNGANHPHTAWRDFAGDFGEDILARHYGADHARDAK